MEQQPQHRMCSLVLFSSKSEAAPYAARSDSWIVTSLEKNLESSRLPKCHSIALCVLLEPMEEFGSMVRQEMTSQAHDIHTPEYAVLLLWPIRHLVSLTDSSEGLRYQFQKRGAIV